MNFRVPTPRGLLSPIRGRWKALLRPLPTRPDGPSGGSARETERSAPSVYWPTDKALALLHGPARCKRCGGRGWVPTEDPLYPEALIDARCPDCAAKAQTL